jgi:hypothetical protein
MRLLSIFIVIFCCIGCEQQSNRLYKLDDVATPHIFKPGDRTQFGVSIISTAQPTYDTANIERQAPANPLTLPDGSNVDLMVEKLSASLDGLESVFSVRYVAQSSDGSKWLYGFSSGDFIYWLYNEQDKAYGIPYWPLDVLDWENDRAYDTILRRCSLNALTECAHAGSMSVTIGYGGAQEVKTPLARFESHVIDYFVTLSIPDIGGVPSQYYETIWYYPGAGEIRFLLSVPGVNSKQYLGEVISTTLRLPTVPSQ